MLRVVNMALDTLRVATSARGRKLATWIVGFVQTLIFVYLLTEVIQDLTNIPNLVAYAAGFASGNVLGIWIEERMALGHTNLRIISPKLGTAVAERLRKAGYAVTEIPARGRDGAVSLLNLSVLRKDVGKVRGLVEEVDPGAFITAEEMRPVWRGFWRE